MGSKDSSQDPSTHNTDDDNPYITWANVGYSDSSGGQISGGSGDQTSGSGYTFRSQTDDSLRVKGTLVADDIVVNSEVDEELAVGNCIGCGSSLDIWAQQLVVVLMDDKRRIRPDPPCCFSCLDNKTLAQLRDEIRDRTGYEMYQGEECTIRVHEEEANPDKVRGAMDKAWGELVTIHALLDDDPATA